MAMGRQKDRQGDLMVGWSEMPRCVKPPVWAGGDHRSKEVWVSLPKPIAKMPLVSPCAACSVRDRAVCAVLNDGELEMECEQYVTGFTDLYLRAKLDERDNVCLPKTGNRADEIRWAFMRWAHENFEQRDMPAVDGLIATVQVRFKCP